MYARRLEILTGPEDSVKSYIMELLERAEGKEGKAQATIIEEKLEEASGNPSYMNVIRRIILQTIDMFWIEHLETMDYMRSSVNLRAYGQRDPLVEYKREGLQLFKSI